MTTQNTSSLPRVYQNITDLILTKLEQGVAPWQKPWSSYSGYARNLCTGKEYQGINWIILNCVAQYDNPYYITYKQAQEMGGQVRKGEKSLPIVFYSSVTKEIENDNGEIEETSYRFAKGYNVFNISQCDGLEIPESEQIELHPENEIIETAERVQLAMPNRPRVEIGSNSATYSPSSDTVRVPSLERFTSSSEYYSALFHELAHSTGHESRLNREMRGYFEDKHSYSFEELIAEMTSTFLCSHCGFLDRTIDNSAAYLNGWHKYLQDNPTAFVRAAAQAQKAADYILNIQRAA